MGLERDVFEGVAQALFDQADGKVGDVDANPLSPEFFGGVDGGAAAAERVKHHVAGVGRGGDDAFEQSDRLLGGVAKAFFANIGNPLNVIPNAVCHLSRQVIEIVDKTVHSRRPIFLLQHPSFSPPFLELL